MEKTEKRKRDAAAAEAWRSFAAKGALDTGYRDIFLAGWTAACFSPISRSDDNSLRPRLTVVGDPSARGPR